MRRLVGLGVWVLVAALTGGAPAQEKAPAPDKGKKYDLSERDRWQSGDLLTTTEDSTETRKFKITDKTGKVLQSEDETVKLHAVHVTKCLEAGAENRLKKSLVYFKDWSLEKGGRRDACLKGTVIQVMGRGTDREWVRISETLAPTEEAKNWLDGRFGETKTREEDEEAALAPKAPVAVGESWKPDLDLFLKGDLADMPVDRASATATRTLKAVDLVGGQTVARVRLEMSLPLTGFPGAPPGAPVKWIRRGNMKFVGEESFPLGARLRSLRRTMEITLDAEADVEGARVRITTKTKETNEDTLGGEIPAELAAGGETKK
ncbi:MAG: hypothetical protein L0216_10085 [Planctomycetales bacterium]|nr:hypothetical protein [Planctomycetales bacterium]